MKGAGALAAVGKGHLKGLFLSSVSYSTQCTTECAFWSRWLCRCCFRPHSFYSFNSRGQGQAVAMQTKLLVG